MHKGVVQDCDGIGEGYDVDSDEVMWVLPKGRTCGKIHFHNAACQRLGGIQNGGTAASPSFITGSPASNAGSSKKGQIVSNMGEDVVVECTGLIQVEFEIHPKYAVNQKLPAVCTEAGSRRRNTTQKMPAMPVVTRVKASETCKCLSPPGTPRSTSKASNTSTTLECEKHAMLSIADLLGAREK